MPHAILIEKFSLGLIMFTRLKAQFSDLKNWQVLTILFVLFSGGSLWSLGINLRSDHANFAEWGESWLQNFSTEMFGAFLTFMLLTLIVGTRQEKQRLIRQLGSRVNSLAQQAAEDLRAYGCITDGSLRGKGFQKAHLEETKLWEADLQDADFFGARLQRADLWAANLQGVNFEYAEFDEATNLPDGSHWTPDTDMSRFTDPTHPDFWRSDDPHSPAYRGKR
jgi:hypothetical protein